MKETETVERNYGLVVWCGVDGGTVRLMGYLLADWPPDTSVHFSHLLERSFDLRATPPHHKPLIQFQQRPPRKMGVQVIKRGPRYMGGNPHLDL